MTALRGFPARLRASDAQQYLALYLVALVFALLATWPTGGASSNDSWFALAYTRSAGLSLLGLGYGMTLARESRQQRVEAVLMLAAFALLGLPLELAAYAASYPATPVLWALAVPIPTVLAMFGIGSLLGLVLARLRLQGLAPLLAPLLLVGMVILDVSLGLNVLNPVLAAVRVTWPHAGLLLAGCVASLATIMGSVGSGERS